MSPLHVSACLSSVRFGPSEDGLGDRTTRVESALHRARAGGQDALVELLELCRDDLSLLAASRLDRRLRGKVDAADVVQETLFTAHQAFRRFRGTTEPEWSTWIRQILVNKVADVQRRFSLAGREVSRERSLESGMNQSSVLLRNVLPTPDPSPSSTAERRELCSILADVLAILEPEDREVVVLRNLHELGWKAIGTRMNRSPDAARMLWARALQRVRGLLSARTS